MDTAKHTNNLLRWLLYLALADSVITLFWFKNGWCDEWNIWLRVLLDYGTVPFVTAKLAVTFLGAGVLSKHADKTIALIGATTCVAIYTAVLGVHAGVLVISLI